MIADAEAARDDPDAVLTSVPLQVAENQRAFLRVELPFETIGRLHTVAEANDLTMGEVITRALDAFEATDAPPEASPPPQRRRKSARAS